MDGVAGKLTGMMAAVLLAAPFLFSAAPENAPDPLRDKARSGDSAAQLALGDEYFFARGGRKRNPALAAYWFRQAADGGNISALYNLAVCYEKGWGVAASSLTAYDLFRRAAEAGLPEARLRQAKLLFAGVPEEETENVRRAGLPADRAEAFELLRGLIQSGYAPAERELAVLILTDPEARRKFAPEARRLLEHAAIDRDAEALLLLAGCYRDGIGGAADPERAAAILELAVSLGDPEAAALLARALEFGHGRKSDPERAFQLTRQAAEGGSPRGLTRLGDAYLRGDRVGHDPVRAAGLYRQAAERGYPPAQLKLGNCYRDGIGFAKDPEKAVELYEKAARSGDPDAQYQFGVCYRDGIGVPKDPAAAVFWFRSAIGLGSVDALRDLGIALLSGEGVPADPVEGAKLLRAAADAGDSRAILLLNRL